MRVLPSLAAAALLVVGVLTTAPAARAATTGPCDIHGRSQDSVLM
jgi:hypothetical protein